VPASFEDQFAIVEELLREVDRMDAGEKRFAAGPSPGGYERELRLAGLAQRVAQAYTIIEGVLAFVARRIDRVPVTGEDWHKKLISRCARPLEKPTRPALISAALAEELLELCEFRHVVRNIYPTRLAHSKVRENLERLIRAARDFGAQCKAFAAGLSPARKPRRRGLSRIARPRKIAG
jgi:ribonuclease HepT-like protein